MYRQAMALYQVGDFTGAKDKFVKVEVVYPDYKDVAKYFKTIDADIERKAQNEALKQKTDAAEPVYAQALELYRAQQFTDAKKKFLQVQMIFPGYRDTETFLGRVDQDIHLAEERKVREEQLRQAEAI